MARSTSISRWAPAWSREKWDGSLPVPALAATVRSGKYPLLENSFDLTTLRVHRLARAHSLVAEVAAPVPSLADRDKPAPSIPAVAYRAPPTGAPAPAADGRARQVRVANDRGVLHTSRALRSGRGLGKSRGHGRRDRTRDTAPFHAHMRDHVRDHDLLLEQTPSSLLRKQLLLPWPTMLSSAFFLQSDQRVTGYREPFPATRHRGTLLAVRSAIA